MSRKSDFINGLNKFTSDINTTNQKLDNILKSSDYTPEYKSKAKLQFKKHIEHSKHYVVLIMRFFCNYNIESYKKICFE